MSPDGAQDDAAGPTTLLPAPDLAGFATECFHGLGVPAADAALVAEVLLYADLRGLEAHGLHRVPAYLDRVAAGLARGGEAITEAGGSGAVRRLDAGGALGAVAACRATDLAIELAGTHGVGVVAVGRANHLGAAGFYVLRAAQRELVAVVTSNATAAVAPAGAAVPFVGTDPIAIGMPLGRHGAFVHDMATGPSRARIRRTAEVVGGTIEPGLAVDADGVPTVDAAQALLGTLLPVGGAKGSGLAMAIALLSGMLGGSAFDDEIPPTHPPSAPQDIGHLVVVVDPWCLTDRAPSLARVEAMVDRLHALPSADGAGPVRFPGERAAALAARRHAEGVPVPLAELRRWAASAEAHGLVEQARWARSRAQDD